MKGLLQWFRGKIVLVTLVFFSMVIIIPLWMVITGSFMEKGELLDYIAPVILDGSSEDYASWNLLPAYPTLKPYVELLVDSPSFFVMFWNSFRQVFPILAGQVVIASGAAWAFARYAFPLKKPLFLLYMVLMILPFQVTMVSNYLVMDKLRLMDTDWAVILPGIFSTFPVFIMQRFFMSIPNSLMEAARLDGANEVQIFIKVGIPIGKSGILSAVVLGFLEYWNAIEQPLTFLQNKSLWPLALYLPNISADKIAVSMTASIIMIAPAMLVFLFGQTYLEQGIQSFGVKE